MKLRCRSEFGGAPSKGAGRHRARDIDAYRCIRSRISLVMSSPVLASWTTIRWQFTSMSARSDSDTGALLSAL
jgi:hypothetical protein